MALSNNPFSIQMRVIHRYLGFFLAGVMAMYAISGIIMIFRQTNFLKHEVISEKQIEPNLSQSELEPILKMPVRNPKTENGIIQFDKNTYDPKTGLVILKKMELPYIIDKMERLHKATTKSPLYYFNIFFGLSLLFFVISAFWMYTPKMPIFKKGIYFTIGGIILTLIMLFV